MDERVDPRKSRIRLDGKPWAKRKKRPQREIGPEDRRRIRMRYLWGDPWHRKRMLAKRRREQAKNPAKYSRYNVPDGMTRKQANKAWAQTKRKVSKFIEMMKDDNILPDVIIPNSDEAKAEAALRETCLIAFGPGAKPQKLQALRTILEYTKAKPESKSKVTLNKSEDFLAAIANEIENGK